MSTVTVVDVRAEHDMRWKHHLRGSLPVRRLKPGQVIVCINRAETMARVVDHRGGVHDYWTDDDAPFDVDAISEYMRQGIGVTLHQPKASPQRRRRSA